MTGMFGTDGIRGHFGRSPFDHKGLARLANAFTLFLQEKKIKKPVTIARDTRISGLNIQDVLVDTLTGGGIDVICLDVAPTPALVFAIFQYSCSAGFMISASHNPWHDNGLKLFNQNGSKITQAEEASIEAFCGQTAHKSTKKGRQHTHNITDAYINFLLSPTGPNFLKDIHIVLDCAHGAYSAIAPSVFRQAGATVTDLYNTPDGYNINDHCGTTYPHALQKSVQDNRGDFGVAFDGDGDRLLVCLRDGTLLDGDQLLTFLALDYHEKNMLKPPIVVSTTMANQAMEETLERHHIQLIRTPVGDRFVSQMMQKEKSLLGGEASGHLILGRHTPTGDGLLSALHALEILKKQDTPKQAFTPYPHHIENIPLKKVRKSILSNIEATQQALHTTLKQGERLLLRLSGTEPLLRIMIEAPSEDQITQIRAQALAQLTT